MAETELKPCPFCGGKAFMEVIEPHEHFIADLPDYGGGAFIECTNCTCSMSAKTEEKAIEAWNRRVKT